MHGRRIVSFGGGTSLGAGKILAGMATQKQLEDQIFQKEGFRVAFTPLKAGTVKHFPDYAYEYMASNKWRVSEWRANRLLPFIAFFRKIDVIRADGSVLKSDLKLGNLRDSYFDAFCTTPDDAEE